MAQNPVYTRRILSVQGLTPGVMGTFVVPAGKRVVVTSIMATNTAGAAQWCWVQIFGTYVWAHQFQAAEYFRGVECRQVAYAGETVRAWAGSTGLHVAVCGFEFTDLEGKPPATKPAEKDELAPTPLPAARAAA